MARKELPLLDGPIPCRGADYVTSPTTVSPLRNTRGTTTFTVDRGGNLIFSCTAETSDGNCLVADTLQPCVVNPLFFGKETSERREKTRITVEVKGGTLTYDPSETTLHSWPGKPEDMPSVVLRGHRGTILKELMEADGQMVGYEDFFNTLWPDGAPTTAITQVQKYISSLRTLVGQDTIEGIDALGYKLAKADEAPSFRRRNAT